MRRLLTALSAYLSLNVACSSGDSARGRGMVDSNKDATLDAAGKPALTADATTGHATGTVDGSTLDAAVETGSGSQDSGTPSDGAPPDAPSDGPSCAPNADYSRDAHNCGYCGHDCLGGQCAAGNCQPTILSSSERPSAITANSTQ